MVVENIRDEYLWNINIPCIFYLLGIQYNSDRLDIMEQLIADEYDKQESIPVLCAVK